MATGEPVQPVAVEKQIYSQKFRYYKDGRKGLRNREKDFMSIRVNVGSGEAVHDIVLVCVEEDVERGIKLHPNGLQGESCSDGVFQAKRRASEGVIKIPHLQIERTKKKSELQSVLEPRMQFLPPEYHDLLRPQEGANTADFDTNKVRLLVLVASPDNSHWYSCWSEVITNEKENSRLEIIRLCFRNVSAARGGDVAVFTASDGPDINSDEFKLYVEKGNWRSDVFVPKGEDINYKRVIHYRVPPYHDPNITEPVTASIVLRRLRGDQEAAIEIIYEPNNEGVMVEKKRKALSPEVLRLSANTPHKFPRRDHEQPGALARPGVPFVPPMQAVQAMQPMQAMQARPAPAVPDLNPVLPPPPTLSRLGVSSSLSCSTYPAPPILFSPPQDLPPSRATPPLSHSASSSQHGYPSAPPLPVSAQSHLHSSQSRTASGLAHSAMASHVLPTEPQGGLPGQAQATAEDDLLAMAMEVIRHDPQYTTADQEVGGEAGGGAEAMEGQNAGDQRPVDFLESLSDLPPLPDDFNLTAFEAELSQGPGQDE